MSISSRIRLWGSCIGKLFGTTLKGPFSVSAGGLAYLCSTPEGSSCSCNALAWPGWFLVFVTMGTAWALEEPTRKDGIWSISAWAPELLCTSERETRLTQDPENNPMSFVGKEHPDQTTSEQLESRAKPKPCFPCTAIFVSYQLGVQVSWHLHSCIPSGEPAESHIPALGWAHAGVAGLSILYLSTLTHPISNTPCTLLPASHHDSHVNLHLPHFKSFPARSFIICSAASGIIIQRKSPGGLHLQVPLLCSPISIRAALPARVWPEFTNLACRE